MVLFEVVEVQSELKEGWVIILPDLSVRDIVKTKEEAEALLREGEYTEEDKIWTKKETLGPISAKDLSLYLEDKHKGEKVEISLIYNELWYLVSVDDVHQAAAGKKVWFME